MSTDLNKTLNLDTAISNLDLLIQKVEKLNVSLSQFVSVSDDAAKSQKAVNESQQQSEKIVDEVTASMAELKKIQDQNAKVQAQLNVQITDSNKELVSNKIALQEEQKALRDSIKADNDRIKTQEAVNKALTTSAKTIAEAQAQNSALRKAVKEVDVTTQSGRDTIAKYNKVIEQNDALITQSSDSFIQQKRNIGNYTESIKAAIPGLNGLTNAAKAFLANPIGATITAITGAFALLKDALNSTEEGQKVLNTVSGVFSGILTGLKEIVISLIKPLIALFNDPQQAINDLVDNIKSRVFTALESLKNIALGVGKILEGVFKLDTDKIKEGANQATDAFIELNKAVNPVAIVANSIYETSKNVANISAETARIERERFELEQRRNKFIVREAELSRDIAKAREDAKNSEIDIEKRQKAIATAEQLTRDLTNERIAIKQRELDLLIQQQGLSSNNLQDNREAAQLQAEIIGLQEQQSNSLKRIFAERDSINKALDAQFQKEADIFNAAQLRREIEKTQAEEDAKTKAELDEIDAEDFQKYLDNEKQKQELAKQTADSKKAFEKEATDFALNNLANAFGLEKQAAIAQSLINTSQAVTKALAQGGIFGIGSAALLSAKGALEVAKISGINAFWKGTKNAPGGLAWVSERGPEIVEDKKGIMRLIPDMSLINLQGGEKIYTNKESKQMLFDDSRIIRALNRQKMKVIVNVNNDYFSYKYRMKS